MDEGKAYEAGIDDGYKLGKDEIRQRVQTVLQEEWKDLHGCGDCVNKMVRVIKKLGFDIDRDGKVVEAKHVR
jgi:hypothetical protein